MAKRDIERALRKKGITAEYIAWEWQTTPSGACPCWNIQLSEADANKFGEISTHFFDTTAEALEWVDGLGPYEETDEPAVAEVRRG